MKRSAANIILIGFSATGKSVVAQEVAHRIGWQAFDIDAQIVREAGKSITDIFAEYGEKKFRELERKVLKDVCRGEKRVIATGGGAVVSPENRELMQVSGVVIRLDAGTATILQRLKEDAAYSANPNVRPLLASEEPAESIERLKAEREIYYAMADATIKTDALAVDAVCQEVVNAWQRFMRTVEPGPSQRLAAEVRTATAHYPIIVGWGILDIIGDRMRQAGLSGKAVIISDENVFGIYGNRVKNALEGTQYKVISAVVPPGEASKSFEEANKLFDFLVRSRVERTDTIVALGGGVVGDLAGFVASGYMRGVPLVQVPTSLVGMVDASIGGKVAVNHPQGKNLVGAFYQPKFVLTDVQTLATLPRRELTSGWAEVIKHGLIIDPGLFEFIKSEAGELVRLAPEATVRAVAESAAIKAQIVSEDEKETGKRVILNYGHTIAHALEAATHYERFIHGEAVAIGMMGAARLAQRLKVAPGKLVKEHQVVLEKFGLPATTPDVPEADIFSAMELDKKTTAGSIRWVLLEDIGKTVIKANVDSKDVSAVLAELFK
jgi:3-dehydroquinate synthase